MTKKEEFIIKIMLQKMKLTERESIALINIFKEENLTYARIIKRKNNIQELANYYKKREYSNELMNSVIALSIKKYSASRIVEYDDLFIKHGYTKSECEQIEKNSGIIFSEGKNTLNNKLVYYNDQMLKDMIVLKPRVLKLSLEVAHARINLFKRKKLSLKGNINILFDGRENFKRYFGVTSEDLKRIYPLPEKYLIKK